MVRTVIVLLRLNIYESKMNDFKIIPYCLTSDV